MKQTPPKVQKFKYGKNYNKSDYSKISYKKKSTTDGRYASPTKKIRKNDINRLPRGLRMDTISEFVKKSRPKKFKK